MCVSKSVCKCVSGPWDSVLAVGSVQPTAVFPLIAVGGQGGEKTHF